MTSKSNGVAKHFTLGKSERLKSRKAIEQLFTGGKKINLTPFRVLYQVTPKKDDTVLQFSVGVSTKNFKKAVDRNRVKRLTREAWRLQKNELGLSLTTTNRQLQVFFIYTSKEIPAFSEVYEKVGSIIQKLGKVLIA